MKINKKKKLVKGFVTYVCKKCGNVARGDVVKILLSKLDVNELGTRIVDCRDEKESCKVCSKNMWRKCILDERK